MLYLLSYLIPNIFRGVTIKKVNINDFAYLLPPG